MNNKPFLDIPFLASIHNRFDIEVKDGITGEITQRAQAFNIICNSFWSRFKNNQTITSYIVYGEGPSASTPSTPSPTDTTLFNRIGGISTTSGTPTFDFDSGVETIPGSIVLGLTTSVGRTIGEVGFGYSDYYITTHALLQDLNGNPITIEKTDTNIITIYATLYFHWNVSGYLNGKVKIVHIQDYSYYYNSFANPIAPRTSEWLYGRHKSSGVMSNAIFDYPAMTELSGGSNYVKNYKGRVDTTQGNDSDTYSLRDIYLFRNIFIDHSFIDFTNFNITEESVGTGDGTNVNFATAFPIQGNYKVYVDGIEQLTGVTVKTGYFKYVSMGFNLIDENKNRYHSWVFHPNVGDVYYLENPDQYSFSKVESFSGSNNSASYPQGRSETDVYVSDDFEHWTKICTTGAYGRAIWSGLQDIGQSYNSPYLKLVITRSESDHNWWLPAFYDSDYNIIFDTAPSIGSVVTVDYTPFCIPKDSNHVLDIAVSLTYGDYQEV